METNPVLGSMPLERIRNLFITSKKFQVKNNSSESLVETTIS